MVDGILSFRSCFGSVAIHLDIPMKDVSSVDVAQSEGGLKKVFPYCTFWQMLTTLPHKL
jgi:hypothetical protein